MSSFHLECFVSTRAPAKRGSIMMPLPKIVPTFGAGPAFEPLRGFSWPQKVDLHGLRQLSLPLGFKGGEWSDPGSLSPSTIPWSSLPKILCTSASPMEVVVWRSLRGTTWREGFNGKLSRGLSHDLDGWSWDSSSPLLFLSLSLSSWARWISVIP